MTKISGETVTAVQGTTPWDASLRSGTGPVQSAQYGPWGVQVSGAVQVSGTVVAEISGQPVKISGEIVALASGNVTVTGVLATKYAVASGYLLSGPSVELDTEGLKLLEIYGLSHASGMATQWRLDVSPDDSLWITDYATYASGTEVKDTLWCGFRYVRLRADPAGASGNTAVLVLSAKP